MGASSTIIERWWLLTFTCFTLLLLFFLNNNGRNGLSTFLNLTVLPKTASTDLSPLFSNHFLNKEPEKSPGQFPSLDLPNSKPSNIKAAKTEAATTSSTRQDPLPGLKSTKPSKIYNDEPLPKTTEKEMGRCNIFDGKWVYDPGASPLYDSATCPFLGHRARCQANGRPDKEYENWRWEANECKIPRLDVKDLLERLRGKRVVLVGDSLNSGQWESLVCLLYSAIPDKSHVDCRNRIFTSKSYNLIVEFGWSPFLVETIVNKTNGKKILKLDSLSSAALKCKGADIMVFNSGHWWSARGRWDWVLYKKKLYTDMELESAFKIGMRTWARWIEKNVDTTKTTVFFRSLSLGHSKCHVETQPTQPDEPLKFSLHSGGSLVMDIVERTIQGMRTAVKYLNVTNLTGYRKDAHCSIYWMNKSPPTPDCSHWCLPGVPDTWNHLLYATMVLDGSTGITIP